LNQENKQNKLQFLYQN